MGDCRRSNEPEVIFETVRVSFPVRATIFKTVARVNRDNQMKMRLNKLIGAMSVTALIGFAWTVPASAAGGWGASGGMSAGVHGGGFSRGTGMRGSPHASFGPGPSTPPDGRGWDHDHDGDHDHHHHHRDDGGNFFFFDDPYFDYGDSVDYEAAPADDGYWYYCPASQSYFPYVRDCASEWVRVSPTPPDSGN